MYDYVKERKEKFKQYLEFHDEIVSTSAEWLEEFGSASHPYNITAMVCNDAYPPYVKICYEYEYESSCGRVETDGEDHMPLAAVWNPDEFFEQERKARQEKLMKLAAEQREANAKKKRLAKAQRYEEYLVLRKEFGENS